MLTDKDVAATVAVRDMARARRFYEETLGLRSVQDMGEAVRIYRSGAGRLVVYVSDTAGSGRATCATWDLGETFDEVMAGLKAKGVVFEHYDDLPGLTRQGDVHLSGEGFKAAWFKDPDGNILHVNSA